MFDGRWNDKPLLSADCITTKHLLQVHVLFRVLTGWLRRSFKR